MCHVSEQSKLNAAVATQVAKNCTAADAQLIKTRTAATMLHLKNLSAKHTEWAEECHLDAEAQAAERHMDAEAHATPQAFYWSSVQQIGHIVAAHMNATKPLPATAPAEAKEVAPGI
jgi:hypothetical protein